MTKLFTAAFIILTIHGDIFIPIGFSNRRDISTIKLTEIGQFGMMRKARAGIPQHFHTGIDIRRPDNNYHAEPIFSIAEGIVISKRTDGPFANLIIEHKHNGIVFWSLYEHIAGIKVNVSDKVQPDAPIARFMNTNELNEYGWQFDHFHLEILKVRPVMIKQTRATPERYFNSYTLTSFSLPDLESHYYDPIEFLRTYK